MGGSGAHDVTIVGGGIVGASIAYWLAPHCRVVLLEAEAACGYHATGRSAALYAPAYGPPMVRALTRASREFLFTPPDGYSSTPLLATRGAMFVTDDAGIAAARDLQAALSAEGAKLVEIDGTEACRRVPVLRSERCALGLYDDDAYDIDVDALLQGFLRGARARGAEVLAGRRVERLTRDDAGLWSVHAGEDSQVRSKWIVNAAGAWADEVAELAGAGALGIEPRRRTAFLFDAPAGIDCRHWPAVLDAAERWYLKPDAGMLLGSPANADPVPPHDVVPEEIDVATGIYLIEEATTLRIERPRRAWAGLRTFAKDGEPVCGASPHVPGFFWAAGLGGYGIQTAPAFGRLCADLLRDGAPGSSLALHGVNADAVSPARFTTS